MTSTPRRILVSGAGSIGMRHARNLGVLGEASIAIAEPDAERLKAAKTELGVRAFADIREALKEFHPTIVFICSPTKEHVPQALLAVMSGADVFIEKPVSHSLEGMEELETAARDRIAMIGCNMRFHPGPKQVKQLLDAGEIGTVKRARIHAASYLPDWRPGSDYRKNYSADPAQGGAILDFIHEIDLALWYAGPATLSAASVKPATAIGLSVDGEAAMTLAHASGAVSDVTVSFVKKGYERGCDIEGSDGRIVWTFGRGVQLLGADGAEKKFFAEPEEFDFNQVYVDEIRYFLGCSERRAQTFSSLREGKAALTIALAARAFL
jgi:predicted dehydrogenase